MFEILFQILCLLTLLFGIFLILSLLFSKGNRGKILKRTLYLSLPLGSALLLFGCLTMLESRFFRLFDNMAIIFVFEIEFIGIIIGIIMLYFTLKKNPRPPYLVYILEFMGILFLHIILTGIMEDLIHGTIIVAIISLAILLYNDFFRGNLKSIIHTIEMNLKSPWLVKESRFQSTRNLISSEYLPISYEQNFLPEITITVNIGEKKKIKKRKIKFWHATVEITQPPANIQFEHQQIEKTWLKDFF